MNDTQTNEAAKEDSRIFLAGFADHQQARDRNMSSTWISYPATPEGYEQAIIDCYTATSVFEFSHEVPDDRSKAQPLRFGDLILDFDAKKNVFDDNGEVIGKEGDIATSLDAVTGFIDYMHREYALDPEDLFYYASGSKGFHMILPGSLFGITNGCIELNLIYKQVCNEIFRLHRDKREFFKEYVYDTLSRSRKYIESDFESYIDPSGFKGGKGQLIRLPNIQRTDGKYKVPVTCDEICTESVEFFKDIVLNKRVLEDEELRFAQRANLQAIPKLEELFLHYKNERSSRQINANTSDALNMVTEECEFINFFHGKPYDVDEPRWFYLARVLTFAGGFGMCLFHTLSRFDKQRYNRRECNEKLRHAFKYGVATCKEIRKWGYCQKDCGVKCPIDIYQKKHADSYDKGSYDPTAEGLYYYPDSNDLTNKVVLSSYIKVKALSRDENSISWSKFIEVQDPDNIIHHCIISNTDLSGSGELALAILSDNGLWYDTNQKTKLLNYLRTTQPSFRALLVYKNGWVHGSLKDNDRKKFKYFPLDQGEQEDGMHLYARHNTAQLPFERLGELEDWQNHIAKPCEGNPLLQLAIMTALSGPFLTLAEHQGFGVHLYANSSSGKTTALKVASSVTGCAVKTWRTTSNALESIAMQHNDNCLLLDEVHMVKAEDLGEIAYMLANGEGKSRAKRTGEARDVLTWNVVGMSSGETAIGDRINQGYNRTAMAGQEVRCISILADGGKGLGIFSKLPEGKSAAEFADTLVRDSDVYKGAPLEELIKCIKFEELDPFLEIDKYSKIFLTKYVKKLEAQALRVAKHFAFIGAVGELCIDYGILPWKKGSAFEAAKKCLQLWLHHNGAVSNFEARDIANRILKDVGNDFYHKFYISESTYQNSDPVQKYTTKDGKECCFIARKFLEREGYLKDYQYDSVVEYLRKNKFLVLNRYGKVQDQKWNGSNKDRPRGFSIIKDNIYLDDTSKDDVITDTSTEASKEYIEANNDF